MSGCPGTGKTTLSSALAGSPPRGVHILSDRFYEFLAHCIPQTLPASHAQNQTVLRAVAQAGITYAQSGYDVYIDGVIGPWFLDVFRGSWRGTIGKLNYVVLRATLEETVRRATVRSGPDIEAIVRAMHPKFASLGPLESHVMAASDQALTDLVDHVGQALDAGRFLVA